MAGQAPVYLIDGNAYLYRAYHAIAPLTTSHGLPTHAVYGFTSILLRVLREKKPSHCAVAFDVRGPVFRHQLYPAYKANRPPMPDDLAVQVPYVKEVVRAYRIPVLEQEGMEADDLIAAAAHRLVEAGHRVVIVSGDKDLLQLVSDRIQVWEPMKDVLYDGEAVAARYQVPPDRLLDLFALLGDSSDNVPGVAGIGPKTGEKLVNQFGSLEGIYDSLGEMRPSKLKTNLEEQRQAAFLSRDLIRLRTDIEVPAALAQYELGAPDQEALRELYTRLEFSSLLKKEVKAPLVAGDTFQRVASVAELRQVAGELAAAGRLVLDTETTSTEPLSAALVGLSLCSSAERAWYVPIGHRDQSGALLPGQLRRQEVLDILRPLLEDQKIPKLGHNLKFDYGVLRCQGEDAVRLAGPLLDTMVASYLLAPERRSHKLDDLCQELLGERLTSFTEVTGGDKRPDAFAYVGLEEATKYSCEDVYGACRLWDEFRPQLEGEGLAGLYDSMEGPLIAVLADMELAGVTVDPELLAGLSSEFAIKLETLEKNIYQLAGEEFNINSPRQLGAILFEKLKLPHGKKTKTGYSTDSSVLEKLGFHELPRAVSEHRNLTKLKSTYIDKLASLVHPETRRVHTSFNQTVTATGRLSSSNPNLQNIPIRTEEGQRIRAAFVPAPGHLFVAGDYSQIDLRVLAHYSGDAALIESFRSGEDIHRRTAAEIFFVSPLLVTAEMRRVAKTINFGIVYGMSSFGLASQLNLSRKEAQTFIDRYFARCPGVKEFMEKVVEEARGQGFVTTLCHRRRSLPDINSPNRGRREFAERAAINTPIQGTAADIIKLAMLRVEEGLRKAGLGARMLLQIHDELVLEAPSAEAEETSRLVQEIMESVFPLEVPLAVNMAVGENLAAV